MSSKLQTENLNWHPTKASITVGVSGNIKYQGEIKQYPYFRDRLHPVEQTDYAFYVNVGAEDFDIGKSLSIQILDYFWYGLTLVVNLIDNCIVTSYKPLN